MTTTIEQNLILTTPLTLGAGTIEIWSTMSAAITEAVAKGTLVNDGTVLSSGPAVSLVGDGVVTNAAGALISGISGVIITGSGTVTNAGRVNAIGTGIEVGTGSVLNEAGGVIEGAIVSTGLATVTNAGTVARLLGALVDLQDGGIVNNLGTASALTGLDNLGVQITGATGTVTNQGEIDGISLQAGGVLNNSGYVGLGLALYGIGITGGTGTVVNSGFIAGAALWEGGTVANAAGATISGNYTGLAAGDGGVVTNHGTILGVGGQAGGSGSNLIGGAGIALTNDLSSAADVTNFSGAIIHGTRYGIQLSGTGSDVIVNNGLIEGRFGIRDTGSGNVTIIDSGTISGGLYGAAISFGSGNDTLILEPGWKLNGLVEGGSGTDVVEFTPNTLAGGLNWISTAFTNDVTFMSATPTMSVIGSNTIVPHEIMANSGLMIVAGTLDSFGTLVNSGTIEGSVTLSGTYAGDIWSSMLLNEAGGVIEGGVTAAAGFASATIYNAGTIANPGGVAVSLTTNGDVLLLAPTSTVIGKAEVQAGVTSALELEAGTTQGTVTGLGTTFLGFAALDIASGADWVVQTSSLGTVVDNGTLVAGLAVTLAGAITGNGTLAMESANPLTLDGTVAAGTSIALTEGATLIVNNVEAFSGTMLDFAGTGTIDLTGMAYSAHEEYVRWAGGTDYQIVDGDQTFNIDLPAGETEYFHLSSDGLDGTDITESAVPCFLARTMIATPDGETAVEDLRIGDIVLNAERRHLTVKWIGRRAYRAPLPANPDIVPVRIIAGAIHGYVPARDLYLSPLHAIRIDGFLVPAGALVNGVSILSCDDLTEIEYFHIETEAHDTVIANGLAAETFIDDDSRKMFDNAAEYYRLYPAPSLGYTLCAPRLQSGAELERIRRKVALRCGVLLDQGGDSDVIGYLETADRQTITGWAFNPDQPNVPVVLDIFNRGALLARTVANIPRVDVKVAGFGHGRCGFSLTLPAPLPALMRHEISVRPHAADSGQAQGAEAALTGSPIVIDPGVAHDLLRTGALNTLIDAAMSGISSAKDMAMFGSSLEAMAKQIQLKAELPHERRPGSGQAAGQAPARLALVLDEQWPSPAHDAGSAAVLSHIAAFQALGYAVAFCATSGAPRHDVAFAGLAALQRQGVQCYGQDGATPEAVIRRLSERGLDVAYLHRLAVASAYAGLIRQMARNAYVLYAVADLHHVRLARQAAATDRPDLALKAAAVKSAELWAMRLADGVITHSPAEAALLRQMSRSINVHVVPWAVEGHAPMAAGRHRQHIGFIGGAGHAPNTDAITHLARDIMPAVWARDPSVRCLVAGAGWPEHLFQKLDLRIVSLGHQPDLGTFLKRVRLTVAPLRFGAGIKGKVLASFAHGVPVAMTGIAAEGLRLDPALQGCVGDGDALAEVILRLNGDRKAARIAAQSGIDLVQDGWSEAAVLEAMRAALAPALSRQGAPAPLEPVAA